MHDAKEQGLSKASPAPAEPRSTPWWLWPHVLSLEAPLVAVLWQRVLAHAHGIRLTPMLDAGLALACWVIYVIDRTLDTFAVKNAAELDVRHAFYHRHRRVVMFAVVPVALSILAWMALFVIPEGVLWQAGGLSLLVALYLASWSAQGSRASRDFLISCAGLGGIMLITRMPAPAGFRLTLCLLVLAVMVLTFLRQLDLRLGHLLPKEFAAALLFALGCTTSTRFLAMPENVLDPVLECLLLAAVFACNLHGIAMREKEPASQTGHTALVIGSLLFALSLLRYIDSGALEHALRGPAQAAAAAIVLHAVVHGFSRRVSAEAHRVLADLALIVPLPLAWL
ncbi:MAG: hypothetical protein IAE77_04615 [Prosthecobacter sp.]|nr:hypothetical protein [Prosthecobacter sp.]